MKKIFYYAAVLFAALAISSCGSRPQQTDGEVHSHEGHVHDHEAEGHDHAAEAHNHDGEVHSHEGDVHDHEAEGHDHAAEAHSHEGEAHSHEGDVHDHEAEGHDHAAEAHSHEGEGHNHEGEDSHHSDEIIFPQSQAARTDFLVAELVPTTFNRVIKCSGEILAAQGDEAVIVAPISGVVSFADAKLAPGASLGKGQKAFYISSGNLATGNEFAKIQATYNQTKAEYDRLASLVEDRIVSQSDFRAAESAYLKAKAEYDAVASAQSGKGTSVNSSIGGYVTVLNVKEGDYVTMGQPLVTVSQNRRMQLRADLSHKYYPQSGSLLSANFVTPAGDTYSLASLHGKLLSVGRNAGDGSTLIPVTFEFDNPGNLIQNSFVEVYLIGAPVENALVLPLTAITEAQGLYYAYVQLDEEGYQRREVKLGGSDGKQVQILSGLTPGERVVMRGAINVKMAAASGAIPHSHTHNH